MGFIQKGEFMDKKFWFLKIFALGVSLGIVVWAIEILRRPNTENVNVPAVTRELPSEPIPAHVQPGPRPKNDR